MPGRMTVVTGAASNIDLTDVETLVGNRVSPEEEL